MVDKYMTEEQLKEFREILLARKEQLMEEMEMAVKNFRDNDNYADPVDQAAQEEKFNLELRTRDRERKLIKKIDEALERINNGEYGYCLDCGAEIGVARLRVRPTATQCIECKRISEIKEKQTSKD